MLRLIRPCKEHELQALDFKQEFFNNSEKVINGSELLDQMDNYDEWLLSVTNNASKETVDPDWSMRILSSDGLCNDAAGGFYAD